MSDHHSLESIIELMKSFGVSGTEAKAYLALLRENPATGYEIAAGGNVPRSAIYSCLKKLESNGLIIGLPGKPSRYIPKSPDQVVRQFEARSQRDLRLLKEALLTHAAHEVEAPTWTLKKETTIDAEIERLMDEAESSLIVSLWSEDAEKFRNAIERATGRGVTVVLFSFTPLGEFPCTVMSYGIETNELETHWPRRILLLTDNQRLLTGTRGSGDDESATYSEEPALTQMALANMVLDMTLYGERHGVDTSGLVAQLTPPLAPIDEWVAKKKQEG